MKNFFFIFNKFILNLYYLARPNKFNPIFYLRLYNETKSKRFIKNIFELNRYISEVTKHSSANGVSWILHKELYKTVRKIKPKFVLELGSGISSTTIAYALKINKDKENIDGKLISMEENEFYHNEIKKFTSPDLHSYINFVLSKRITKKVLNLNGSFFLNIPKNNYDIIFIDGPTSKGIPPEENFSFNADIINILSEYEQTNFCPSDILLDKRLKSLEFIKKILPETKFTYYVTKNFTRINYKPNQKINK